MPATFITPELFRFLGELSRHNDREWFNAHKEQYIAQVRDPLLGFVLAIGPKMRAISSHIMADPRPTGGSLLRIYRDTRFSRDKKPYKTHAALVFRLGGRNFEAPGYYLHLEPGTVFLGAGMWHPSADGLRAIREAIVKDPSGWKRAKRSGIAHAETALKRPPRGFDPDHPLIEDLKRTSFTTGVPFTERQACSPRFAALFVQACRREAPLMRFLARALGVSF